MVLSNQDAIAAVGAPGQLFEVIEVERHGIVNREFKNSPKNLRELQKLQKLGLHCCGIPVRYARLVGSERSSVW